ncbi:MAG: DUF2845 domain-containing protein [Thermodesulfobacteriota bacterium]
MKRITLCLSMMVVLLFSVVNNAHGFTCGKKIFSVGDLSFEILIGCGEPALREIIGYRLAPDQRRETVIERWVYGPIKGFYKVLTFEGGVLIKEDSIIKK